MICVAFVQGGIYISVWWPLQREIESSKRFGSLIRGEVPHSGTVCGLEKMKVPYVAVFFVTGSFKIGRLQNTVQDTYY